MPSTGAAGKNLSFPFAEAVNRAMPGLEFTYLYNAMPTPTHYFYIIESQQVGPKTANDLIASIQSGELKSSTLICQAGGKQWKPLSQHPELAAHLPSGSRRSGSRIRVNAVPQAKPSPTPVPDTVLSSSPMEIPVIAKVLQIIAALNLFLGFIVAILYFSEAFPMSGVIGLSVLLGSLILSVFIYSFSMLMTWVYNIMLNTRH